MKHTRVCMYIDVSIASARPLWHIPRGPAVSSWCAEQS